MRSKPSLPFLVLAACLLLAGVEAVPAQEELPKATVATVPAVEREVHRTLTFTGTVEPRARSAVASEIEGLVKEVFIEEGDFVAEGTVMIRLKDATTRLALANAEAAFAEAKALYEKTRRDLDRALRLHEKGFLSDEERQDKKTDVTVAEKRMQQWQIQIVGYKGDLEKTRIKAPFGGMVSDLKVQVGEWVREGGVVAELIDLDTVHVTADVAERYIGLVQVGQEARVRVDAYPEKRFPGRVFAVVPQARSQARSFPVKIAVQNPGHVLRSGMFARADFAIGEPYRAFLVPKDALVSQGGNYVVYIVQDGIALPVPVKLGDAFEDMVSVEAEIPAGAPVIVRGNERLFPSQPVEVLPPEP